MQNIEITHGVVISPTVLRQCEADHACVQELIQGGDRLPESIQILVDRRLHRGHHEMVADAETWRSRRLEQQQWETANAPKKGEIVWEGDLDNESTLNVGGVNAWVTRIGVTDEWEVEVWGIHPKEVFFKSSEHPGKIVGGDLARAVALSVMRGHAEVHRLIDELEEARLAAASF